MENFASRDISSRYQAPCTDTMSRSAHVLWKRGSSTYSLLIIAVSLLTLTRHLRQANVSTMSSHRCQSSLRSIQPPQNPEYKENQANNGDIAPAHVGRRPGVTLRLAIQRG